MEKVDQKRNVASLDLKKHCGLCDGYMDKAIVMYELNAVNKGYMKAFNDYYASNYAIGQLITEADKKALIGEIDWFNNKVAQGEAVWLELVW